MTTNFVVINIATNYSGVVRLRKEKKMVKKHKFTIEEMTQLLHLRLRSRVNIAEIADLQNLNESASIIKTMDMAKNLVIEKMARRLSHNHRAIPLISIKDAKRLTTSFFKELRLAEKERTEEERAEDIKPDKLTRTAQRKFVLMIFEYIIGIEMCTTSTNDPYQVVLNWITMVHNLSSKHSISREAVVIDESMNDEIIRQVYTREDFCETAQKHLAASINIEDVVDNTLELDIYKESNRVRVLRRAEYERNAAKLMTILRVQPGRKVPRTLGGVSRRGLAKAHRQEIDECMLLPEHQIQSLTCQCKQFHAEVRIPKLRARLAKLQATTEQKIVEKADRIYG